jgi:hypothetical protein
VARAEEIDLYRKAREDAQDLGLSDDEKERYLQPHVARWHRFLATRPGNGTDAMSMSPSSQSSGSNGSPQAGRIHLQTQPNVDPAAESTETGRFGMGWLRRKARGKSHVAAPVRT